MRMGLPSWRSSFSMPNGRSSRETISLTDRNVARDVRLQLWQTVSQFDDIQDPIGGPGGPGTLPPAYRVALKLTLAEMLCPGAKREANAELVAAALHARAAIFGNNAKSPRIATQDAGMPKAKPAGQKQDFNWAYGNYPGGRPQ